MGLGLQFSCLRITPSSLEGGNHADLSRLPEITYLPGFLWPDFHLAAGRQCSFISCQVSFVKSKRPNKCPPRHHSLCCSLCKSDLSRKRSCIKHNILLSGKINTLLNSFLLYSAWGTMKPCSVLSMKATGANHLSVITPWYQGKSWEELGALAVLVFAAAGLCCKHHCCLPLIPLIPARTFQLLILHRAPSPAPASLSNGKMCPFVKTELAVKPQVYFSLTSYIQWQIFCQQLFPPWAQTCGTCSPQLLFNFWGKWRWKDAGSQATATEINCLDWYRTDILLGLP